MEAVGCTIRCILNSSREGKTEIPAQTGNLDGCPARKESKYMRRSLTIEKGLSGSFPAWLSFDGTGRRADLTVPGDDAGADAKVIVSGGSAEYAQPRPANVASKGG